jgi:hypothetical protein
VLGVSIVKSSISMTECTFYQCDRRGNEGNFARSNCPARERGMKRKDESDIMHAQAVSPLVNMRLLFRRLTKYVGPHDHNDGK